VSILLDDFAGEISSLLQGRPRMLWPAPKECCPPAVGTGHSHAQGYAGWLLSGAMDSARHAVRRRGDRCRKTGAADEIGFTGPRTGDRAGPRSRRGRRFRPSSRALAVPSCPSPSAGSRPSRQVEQRTI